MNAFSRPFQKRRLSVSKLACVALAILVFSPALCNEQAMAQVAFSGRPTPEQIEKMKEMRRKMRDQKKQNNKPKEEKKDEKKPEEKDKKKDEKKEGGSKTIKRPTDGSTRLDPDRMRLKPDANGLVQFNYNSHPWAEVLQEFADAAKFSFDWQKLPADSLNLITQKKYTLPQARDLLNSLLLSRGFTLILQGEVLTAVEIKKLDPSLVPRVEADLLEDYLPHDFVRVRFQLPPSMDPAKAKDDVKVLLSPNAKVTPLLNTKRLLVIDTVANLRSVRDLIYSEQSAADAIIKPEIYQIRHRRAAYVAEQVMIVLGLDPASRRKPQELQLETQRMQLLMKIQQKGKDVTKLLKKDGPPVHIAVDTERNRIFVNAPPELFPIIARTIERFDVADDTDSTMAVTGKRSFERHKTTSSPDAVVSALMEMGVLHPLTQLQGDAKSNTIFAHATEADHQKIKQLIGRFDGSGRRIRIVWLPRHLPAQQLAGTLTALLVGEKKEDNSRRRYNPFGNNNEKKEVGFKAMADVEKNRLILWANDDENAEVNEMLEQMGASSSGEGRDRSKVRVLEGGSQEETARLLERIQAAYPGKLNITTPPPKPQRKQPKPKVQEGKVDEEDTVTQRPSVGKSRFRTAQLETVKEPEASALVTNDSVANDQAAPQINVVVTEDGRIVLSSDDPAALNQLEDLLNVIEPMRQEFAKFKLQYVYASSVVDKLEEYFAEELKDQTETAFDLWGNYSGEKAKDLGPATLGRRQLLRFISEDYTNTVVVQGASVSQLSIIKELVAVYDQKPEPKDYYARKTEVLTLKYSRAQDIADSLKDVYRELLSSKDKEFQDKEGKQQLMSNRESTYIFGEVNEDPDNEDRAVLIKFDGVLSIGVDAISNALIVSARKEVLESVVGTVKLLDLAAKPDTEIRVHRVRGILPAAELQKMLKGSLSNPWPGGKPQQPAATQGGGGRQRERGNGNQNNNRRRRNNR